MNLHLLPFQGRRTVSRRLSSGGIDFQRQQSAWPQHAPGFIQ
jgi:hypothetical protein